MARNASSPLARSAGAIGAATLTSRILGLVRDQVLAYYFGAGDAMDAFRIAFRLPNVLRDLFAEGAMSAALVPTFARAVASGGKPRAWQVGNNVINLMIAVTSVFVLAGIMFASPLVKLYAGDFSRVPGKLELTIALTRLMFPFLTMVTVAAVAMGMLNAVHRFFIPALSPAMFNIGTIVCALLLVPLAPRLGFMPIAAIAVGTLIGGAGQVLLQWPALRREGFRYAPSLDLRDEGLRQIVRLMGPGVAGLAAVQVNLFVNSWLATSLGTGAVSWLDYAFRLMYMPIGLFGISIATATLPRISGHAALNDTAGVRQSVSSGLRMMMLLNVPATAGLVAPVAASAASVGVNIVLNLALIRVIGHAGLALGTAMAALFNAAILLWLLRIRLSGIDGGRLLTALSKITIASVVMAAAAYEAERVLHIPFEGARLWVQAVRVFGAIGVGLAVLAAAAQLLRIREFTDSVRLITDRLKQDSSPI